MTFLLLWLGPWALIEVLLVLRALWNTGFPPASAPLLYRGSIYER